MSAKTIGYGLIILGLLGFLNMLRGEDRDQILYRASLIAAATAQTADIASSWGGIEANPVLGRGEAFGWRAAGIKAGVVGGCLLIQWAVTRRHPRARRWAAVVNFTMAGATTGVAVQNWRYR